MMKPAICLFALAMPCLLSFAYEGQDPVDAKAVKKTPPIACDGTVIQVLQVKDLAAAKKWYGEVLGCEIVLDLSEMGWCEVTTPAKNSVIGLSQVADGKQLEPNGGSALSFGVKDIEKARAFLLERRATDQAILDIPNTVRLLKFKDPDGNNLMLHQVP